MFTRRDSLRLVGASVPAIALSSCTAGKTETTVTPPLPPNRKWLAKLGEGLPEEMSYSADVEGRLPDGLSGTLYRNGPGLFERNGFRKRNLIDGDGMIRATTFANGQAWFRNHFVRTAKYIAEQNAGHFLYPTWTTPAPSLSENVPCIPSRSQAGVTP